MPDQTVVTMEGEPVRKHWLLSWTLLAATVGCSSYGAPGVMRTAQQPQPTQYAATPPVQQGGPGFTQRMMAAIPGMPQAGAKPNPNVLQPSRQKLDPISLGFSQSGPPNAALYLAMAQMSDQGENVDHARSMYQKALSLEPGNLKALMGLARLEDRQGRMQDAVQVYQQAFVAHPKNVQVMNDLALCHARLDQLTWSLQLLEQATQLEPQKALYRNNIAKVLIEMNRLDEASAHQAAVHPPAVAQYNMGVLLNQRGRSEEAARFLTAATHIDPQLQEARTLLSQITSSTTQVVDAGVSAPNDSILPTPMAAGVAPAGAYPTTGAISTGPVMQTIPTETAQVPVGHAPALLPPVR